MTNKFAPHSFSCRALSSYSAATEHKINGDSLFEQSLDQLVNINVRTITPHKQVVSL